jgi:hypothetical protein
MPVEKINAHIRVQAIAQRVVHTVPSGPGDSALWETVRAA